VIRVLVYQRAKSTNDIGPLMDALRELRNEAMKQPGYITGETLVDVNEPRDILIISTWSSLEHYNAWNKSAPRLKAKETVDHYLAEPHSEKVYGYYLMREGKVWSTL
jgi:heme-degrading monooxygenase HmoA